MNTEYKFNEEILIRYDDGEPSIDNMVAILLLNEVIMLSDYWWVDAAFEFTKNAVNLSVICNDCFMWGSADAEEINLEKIPELYEYWEKDPGWGSYVWCIKKRGMLPQKPVYDAIMKEGIWNLDEMQLEANPTW